MPARRRTRSHFRLSQVRLSRALASTAAFAVACAQPAPRPAPAVPKTAEFEIEETASTAARDAPPVRLFLLPSAEALTSSEPDAGGGRHLITRGMRLSIGADGELERAQDLLPTGQAATGVRLPPRLGDGYLFFVPSSGFTLIWRSKSWTGALTPFANVPLPLEEVFPGLDRIYARVKRTRELLAFDPESGVLVESGPLPVSPYYGSLAFVDGWFGAAAAPFRGLLATFDAGGTWHEVPAPPNPSLSVAAGRIAIAGAGHLELLDRTGAVLHPETAAQDPETNGAVSKEATGAPLSFERGAFPLKSAVLYGYPDSPATAVFVRAGTLTRVRLADGKMLARVPKVIPEDYECQGIGLGKHVGFVCGREKRETRVFELRPNGKLALLLGFDEPRFVASSGNGHLVVRGGCKSRAHRDDAYCVRFADGRLHEMRIRGDAGVERVVALSDGRIAVVIPPRLGAEGRLTLVALDGTSTDAPLLLPKKRADVYELLTRGLWLHGFVERQPGTLAGWVRSNVPFVGIRITLDGKVTTGEPAVDAERTHYAEENALALRDGGSMWETTNGGFDWRESATPPGVQPDLPTAAGAKEGCTRVGCSFGHWLRVGWLAARKSETLALAETPNPTALLSPGGTRRHFGCMATGERSAPALNASPGLAEPRSRRPRGTQPEPTWLPFLELPAPALREGEVGFDGGPGRSNHAFYAYAWGRAGSGWEESQRWVFRGLDRFRVADGLWSTGAARGFWSSPELARRFVGQDTAFASTLLLELDPGGRGGIGLSVSASGVDAFVVEEGQPPRSIGDVNAWGIRSLAGAVSVNGQWYFGALGPDAFRVFRALPNKVELVSEFPLKREERLEELSVVRNTRSDGLGIWTRGAHWHVLRVHPGTGKVDMAERYSAKVTSTASACRAADTGWLLESVLSLQPTVELEGLRGEVETRRVAARWIARLDSVCVAALAADADPETPPLALSGKAVTAHPATVPLTLSDLRPGGRRWAFRCTL